MKPSGPLRRTGGLKRGKRIKPRSDKTAERDALYAELRLAFLGERRCCEIRWEGCTRWSTDVHHMQGRSPAVFFDQSKWMPACRTCHDLVGKYPERAFAVGVSLHRNAIDPDEDE